MSSRASKREKPSKPPALDMDGLEISAVRCFPEGLSALGERTLPDYTAEAGGQDVSGWKSPASSMGVKVSLKAMSPRMKYST
ncbi:hypothetical protein dsmv_1487 [Desulfococcus multivorans DSM 2059]|uniref:Uncharacterized protein n=1 Tax=Desulfococcus multivorans DSM 2059 TaxID=1121405 RepID=S7V8C0_DESML|nr:hypothetical protein dsmv_1487 [Desulfococcus multivorans DSM 2059]SJZ89529.1 hypothetical protein SAMN02745446_02007 [Desulfococcus multivorans DSM 2059]